ncbi:hypothetical protein [Bacillus sp. P14.5]|uniref:hypothetical protein n=1 Tax=Bacillus sp. P14.5 TaxID=1983400 RepID=UPI0013B04FAD|nr:hypothetical protein [Bacillus sp. P14.5]
MSDLVSLYTFTRVFTSKRWLSRSSNPRDYPAAKWKMHGSVTAYGHGIGGKGGFFDGYDSFISGFLYLSVLFLFFGEKHLFIGQTTFYDNSDHKKNRPGTKPDRHFIKPSL